MKMMILVSFIFLFAGCMSDKEYQLRKHQLENQAKHEEVYSPFSMQGPATISLQAGSKFEAKSQTQPFKVVEIPDGQKYQADVAKTAIGVSAGTFLGYRTLKDTKGTTKVITKENGK